MNSNSIIFPCEISNSFQVNLKLKSKTRFKIRIIIRVYIDLNSTPERKKKYCQQNNQSEIAVPGVLGVPGGPGGPAGSRVAGMSVTFPPYPNKLIFL